MASLGKTVVTVKVEFDNPKAMRAFARAFELIHEIAGDQPWNEDAKEAKRAMRYAMKHFKMDVD